MTKKHLLWALALFSGIFIAWLANDIGRKQGEASSRFFQAVQITDEIDDPATWGQNFPLQYADYLKTVDQQRTRYGGSEAMPRTPTKGDPRSIVSQSKLEEDKRLISMFKGYAFSLAFREERGHAYMLTDQELSGRHAKPQVGACIHCHASVYLPYKKAGEGDLFKGFARLNPLPYGEARKHVKHPVACIDCHTPVSMKLRVTRPGFIEGMKALKGNSYDVNRDATGNEMRSYVCGQCHVEYYFKGKEKRLTYPWHRGLKAENALAYYEKVKFKDWVHAKTGANMLKAQHPEFELWSQGIHGRSGVSCADCHMPFKKVGAVKISDHHVRSPLLNAGRACLTCHPGSKQGILQKAEQIQTRHFEMRNRVLDALAEFINDLEVQKGNNKPPVVAARKYHRQAQFLADFIEAENSMGFHAPQEAARVLTMSLDLVRKGQLELRKAAPK